MLFNRTLKYYDAITSNEQSLNTYFNQLNDEGQLKALEIIKLLLKIPEYKKQNVQTIENKK